jgi:prolyl-tRNA synthetase
MAQDKRQVDAITPRDVDFAQWYTDVCIKAELIDYTSVKGMFIPAPVRLRHLGEYPEHSGRRVQEDRPRPTSPCRC